MGDDRGLAGSVRGVPRSARQLSSRGHGMTTRRAGLRHGDLTSCPCAREVDGTSRTVVVRPRLLEVVEDVLGAVGGPQREQVVVVVLEGAAATQGDEPRVADLGEDHSRTFAATDEPRAGCR